MSQQVIQTPSFAQHIFDQVCPENKFLLEMQEVIPWKRIEAFLNQEIQYKSGGRPPYPVLLVYKMHLLQSWYGLSDEGCEFQVKDRLSFREFLGLGISDRIPDATTLENLRHRLAEHSLGERLVALMDTYFVETGLILKEGNLIDATFLRANAKKTKDKDKKTDLDAEFGHKGYGYSVNTNVDRGSKFIRKTHTTSANVPDADNLEPTLIGDEKVMYGDKGYDQPEPRKVLKKRNIKARILWKRKRGKQGEGPKPLPKRKAFLNKAYSKIRAMVEHPYAVWETVFGLVRASYRGLERVNQQAQSLTIAYNFRRLGFLVKREGKLLQTQCA
jgi:IS5 family transposase